MLQQYPSLKSATCCADTLHASIVDAEGKVYKCWCDIGVEDGQEGDLLNYYKPKNNLYLEYMFNDATKDLLCSKCKLLPICMGGCPYKRMTKDSDNCTNQKYILEKVTKEIIKSLKMKRELEKNNKKG